jgi:hypothetical protein
LHKPTCSAIFHGNIIVSPPSQRDVFTIAKRSQRVQVLGNPSVGFCKNRLYFSGNLARYVFSTACVLSVEASSPMMNLNIWIGLGQNRINSFSDKILLLVGDDYDRN